MNFLTRFCATIGAETYFEKARLAAIYQSTQPPEENDIKIILQTLSGIDTETDRRLAFGAIIRKLRQPNHDEDGWIVIIKNLIIIDRCVNDGILLKEICELNLPNIENRKEISQNNFKLLIHEFIQKYYHYIKFKSQYLRTIFSLTLYKQEKYIHFSAMKASQIWNEIKLILQFVTKAFDATETKRNGHLKYKLNQYVFLMILNDLFKYYNCSLVAFNVLIKRIGELDLEEIISLAEITRQLYNFSTKLDIFINSNRFIAGFDNVEMQYQVNVELVELVIQYMNLYEQQRGNSTVPQPIRLNTYNSRLLLEKIFQQHQISKNESEYLEIVPNIKNRQTPSKIVIYSNQFKHKFNEQVFKKFENNYSQNYAVIPSKFRVKNQIIEQQSDDENDELDFLALIEAKKQKMIPLDQFQLQYPEAFDEKLFSNFENIYYM